MNESLTVQTIQELAGVLSKGNPGNNQSEWKECVIKTFVCLFVIPLL